MKLSALRMRTQLITLSSLLVLYLTVSNSALSAPPSSHPHASGTQNNQIKILSQVSLQQLIKIAVNNNAQLASKKLAWESMIEQFPQATALSDPKLVFTEAIDPIETRLGPQDRVLALSQQLPFPGKRGVKGSIVKKDIAISKMRYDKASRDVIVSLKQSYYELAYLTKAVQLSAENKSVLEKITHVATSGYAASSSTLNDVAKAQSQFAQVSYDVLLLQELVSTEKTRINSLLNRNPEHAFEVSPTLNIPMPLKQSINQLYQYAASNEELKIADLNIEKSTLKRNLAGYTSLPDFNVGVRYAQIGDAVVPNLDRSGEDGLALSVGINIPLNHSKNKAIKRQAYLQRQKSLEDKKALLNTMNNKIKAVYFKINNAYRQATLYSKNLLPQAQRAKEVAELQYRENKGVITNYLETQSTWLNFQLAYQRAVADYWKNRAEMEKLTGRAL